jgi:Tfp pilus assembly protein PilN
MIRVNLLGLPKPKKRHAPVLILQGWRSLVLLLAILVLVGLVQFLRYGRLQAEDLRVSKLVRDRQAEKVRLEGIRSEYEKFSSQKALLQKRIDIIEGLKAKQSGPSRLLETLASTVSNTDTLWVTNFEQSGRKVSIEGFALSAKAVADFLTQLKQSKAFSEWDLKETFQDPAVKDLRRFQFTVNGQLAGSPPTS